MSARHAGMSLACAALLVSGAFAAEEAASELDYTLRAGATYSNNVNLQSSPLEDSSSALAFGGELRGSRPTGRFRYVAAMELTYYQYLDYYTGGQAFGRGLLSGSYDFVPDHFRWNASVNYDQLRAEEFRPLAPGNVENLVTLSTGPTLRAELFDAVDSMLDAHYIKALYSEDTLDNQTVGGRIELGHRTGPQSRLGLGGSIDDVSYPGGQLSSALDFQRREAFALGELHGARTDLSAELGYGEAVGETFDGDGPLARIRLERRMSPSLFAYLSYRHEFPTSQMSPTVSDPTQAGGGIVNTSLVTSSPRESWTGELGFRYKRTRSEGEIGFYHLDEKSLIAALGRHTYDEVRARVTRQLTPVSSGSLYVSYSKEDFAAFAEKFDELQGGIEYKREFTRSIGMDARIEFRSGENGQGTYSYDELSGGVFIRYSGSLLGRRQATPQDPPVR